MLNSFGIINAFVFNQANTILETMSGSLGNEPCPATAEVGIQASSWINFGISSTTDP
tara:strand:+ start:699 stop:869 length:171 start_codon:yes stop_codon:yes gene_type:complete